MQQRNSRYCQRCVDTYESIRRAKSRLREITGRSKGRSLEQVIGKLRVYLTGWRNYYSLNELPSLTRNLLGWVRRRSCSLLWKQWKKGRTRYSELRVRGGGIANRLKNDYSQCPDMWQKNTANCYQNNVAWL
ncbi:group II intron maturase-specific domain-containing protein [Symbiopectobacterium sp. RP]|uniref:group II intron maturase-specific domain-containing protein n=1 Tax=Symbiopectobacterium sp. RP TaxID=3248553 RepID=UPI003D2DD2FB